MISSPLLAAPSRFDVYELRRWLREELMTEFAVKQLGFTIVLLLVSAVAVPEFLSQQDAHDATETVHRVLGGGLPNASHGEVWHWMRQDLLVALHPQNGSSELGNGAVGALGPAYRTVGNLRLQVSSVPLDKTSCQTLSGIMTSGSASVEAWLGACPTTVGQNVVASTAWVFFDRGMENAQNQVRQIEKAERSPNKEIRELQVRFVVLNVDSGLISQVSVSFSFDRSITFQSKLEVETMPVGHSKRLLWEGGLLLAVIVLRILMGLLRLPMQLVRTRLCCALLAEFASVVVACATAFYASFIRTHLSRAGTLLVTMLDSSATADDATRKGFYESVAAALHTQKMFSSLVIIFMLIVLLQILFAFSLVPRLSIMIKMLEYALVDLFHWGIVFVSVFVCMALTGVALFGKALADFSNLGSAMLTCFRMIVLGGFWEPEKVSLMQEHGVAFVLWLVSFCILLAILAINCFLAIVMHAYASMKTSADGSQTLLGLVREMNHRWWGTRSGQRVTLNSILNTLDTMPDLGDTITEAELAEAVPGIPAAQAKHILMNQSPL